MTQRKSRLIVSSPIEGTYQVHEPYQPPVQGTAVYRYKYGLVCEACQNGQSRKVQCYHLDLVEQWEAEHGN